MQPNTQRWSVRVRVLRKAGDEIISVQSSTHASTVYVQQQQVFESEQPLDALHDLYAPRLSIEFEGDLFRIGDFQVCLGRFATSSNRASLFDVEYLPAIYPCSAQMLIR